MNDNTNDGLNDDILGDEIPKQNDTEATVPTSETKEVKKDVETKQYQQTEQIFKSFDKVREEFTEMISAPGEYTSNIPAILKGLTISKTPEAAKWAEIINTAAEIQSIDKQFISSLNDGSADFKQSIDVNGDHLGIQTAKIKATQNQELDGDRAVMLVRNTFNMGSHVRIPLFHSGFWLTIKAPTELDLLSLHREITQDKIELGRSTYGLAFSNQVVFYASRLLDFALNNIHGHSVKTNNDIRDYIYAHDIPIIIWGMASAIWPNGFKFARACTSNPAECQHTVEEMVNLSKLLWTNEASLNLWQKSHMANKGTMSMSEENVKRYREELLNNQPRVITITKDEAEISFTLKVPTASQWINQGTEWINQIVDSITSSFSESSSVADRNRWTIDSARASILRQYSHWVESIEIKTNMIKDRDSIEQSIATLSSDDDIRDDFVIKVRKYIDDTIISMIGIPTYDCPKCGKDQKDTEEMLPKFVNIIPLDVFSSFFIPLAQRVYKIQTR